MVLHHADLYFKRSLCQAKWASSPAFSCTVAHDVTSGFKSITPAWQNDTCIILPCGSDIRASDETQNGTKQNGRIKIVKCMPRLYKLLGYKVQVDDASQLEARRPCTT